MAQRIGKYTLKQKLGKGGMGDVYLSQHPQLNYPVAIKLIHTSDPLTRAQFIREAQTASLLSHHNIINILDVDEAGGQFFIVMEQFPRSLEDVLQHGPLPIPVAVELATQLLNGLAYAHRQGIVHRDIKPANVLLRDDDTPVLADFGLARPRDLQHQTGSLAGTPAYIAPEQIRGQSSDERTDIYTFGAMLYQMLTGHLPFTGDSAAMLVSHLQQAPIPPKQHIASIPDELNDLVMWMLEKNPADRPQTVDHVLTALASATAGIGAATPLSSHVPVGQPAATGPTVALKTGMGRTAALMGASAPVPVPAPVPQRVPLLSRRISTRGALALVGGLLAVGLSCISAGVLLSNNDESTGTIPSLSSGQERPRNTSFKLDQLTPVPLQEQTQDSMHNTQAAVNTSDFSYGGVTTRREDDRLTIVGEFRNETSEDRIRLEVRVVLLGSDGKNYFASNLVDVDRIHPGEVLPFEVVFRSNNPPPADFTSIGIDVLSQLPDEYDREPLPESAIQLDGPLQIGLRDEYSSLTVQGDLKNTLSEDIRYPSIIVTLYNDDGDVIDVLHTYGRIEAIGGEDGVLPPGKSVPFRTSVALDDTSVFSKYRIKLDGSPKRKE